MKKCVTGPITGGPGEKWQFDGLLRALPGRACPVRAIRRCRHSRRATLLLLLLLLFCRTRSLCSVEASSSSFDLGPLCLLAPRRVQQPPLSRGGGGGGVVPGGRLTRLAFFFSLFSCFVGARACKLCGKDSFVFVCLFGRVFNSLRRFEDCVRESKSEGCFFFETQSIRVCVGGVGWKNHLGCLVSPQKKRSKFEFYDLVVYC